jgi:hypothetical protein
MAHSPPGIGGTSVDMKKASLLQDAWARLLGPSAPGNTRTPKAALSQPQAIDCVPALIAALGICGVLGGISLVFPPFIQWDSGFGFLAWRGTLLGALNCIISPDRANIARDAVWFLTHWSPGQYLVPGAISLLGVPLGVAMTLTVALSLLACLIGWVMVVRAFVPRTSLALLVTVLIGSFYYSTHAFNTYHGGEILLQAVTPWLVLTAYRVPEMDAVPAGLLAAVAVLFAFLAKLTGLIVVAAALVAGSMVSLAFGRRITKGMIGGALGAVGVFAILYVAFISATDAAPTGWSLPFKSIVFASLAPWVVGNSLSELITYIFFPTRSMSYLPTAFLVFLVPPAIMVAGLVLFWRPQTTNEKKFRLFCLCFYTLVAAVFMLLYIHGPNTTEDRYFRSAGTLLFVCALISALAAGTLRWTSGLFLVLCVVMALYGLAAIFHHALSTADGRSLDRTSWTNQGIFDAAALDFTRGVYAREGRDALFVLPTYQMAVTLPADARIIVIDLDYEPESTIAGRYAGRVPGHVVVLMPNRIFGTSKSRALLSAFTDYAPEAWERETFADMGVFFQ